MLATARTVFLGSGEFAVPVVEALRGRPEVELIAVVTAPARPVGRRAQMGSAPVGRWADAHKYPTLTPARLRDDQAVAELVGLRPDLLVLADYGQIVPPRLLELPPRGSLNLHPSLLPRHRGATPVVQAILDGDARTGVSLMVMDEGLDSGPIIAQRALLLAGDETAPDLERRLADLAAELLADSIGPWLRGELTARTQAADGVSVTRPLRRADGRLEVAKSAAELERQVRAYQPWPGSFIGTGDDRLIVWRASVAGDQEHSEDPPGRLVEVDGEPALVTASGRLVLHEVQPAGGRRMAGAAWLRGRHGRLPAAEAGQR